MKKQKRLFRSKKNHVLTGLLAGIGDYVGVDPVVVRLVFVLVTAFTHFVPGILVYVIGSLIVPKK